MQITCPICGGVDDTKEYINSQIRKIMEDKKVCFHCAYWYNVRERDYSDTVYPYIPVVVNHSHWSYPSLEPVHFEKSYGWSCRPVPTMHYILFKDGRVAETNQLWHQGEIPKHFRCLIPNNAVFITREDFYHIRNHISNKGKAPIKATCPQPLLNFLLKKYEFSK